MIHCLFLLLILSAECTLAKQVYSWAVIGAGPAGIVSVAQLLEHGVPEHEIMWIDPEFSVGRIGKYYGNVPGNQKAGQFVQFLQESSIFSSLKSPAIDIIKAHDPEKEYQLQCAIDVFEVITRHLRDHVQSQQSNVQSLWQEGDNWLLKVNDATLYAHKVILATGSHPKTMCYPEIEEIPLDLALDEPTLQQRISHDDTIMVVGSSHSAFLILKYVYDFGVKKIISIYNQEPRIGMIGGLAGITAYWVQHVLHANPSIVERVFFTPEAMDYYVRRCSKIIYAFGYQPNEITVNESSNSCYDPKTGVIEKNLYGIGIAFPQLHTADDGTMVSLVGFNSFMYRAKTCIPLWLQTSQGENRVSRKKHASCFAMALLEWDRKWI